jgi:hypothetical protein
MTSPLALAILLTGPAQAGCPADLQTLRTDMGAARMAYTQEDLEALRHAVLVVDEDLGCLTERVTPDDALQAHLVHALGWWLLRDEERVAFALRGALAVDPRFLLGDDIAPAGSKLMVLYAQVREQGLGVSAAVEDKLIVDGFEGIRALPMQRASLIQREDRDGLRTWYTSPDGAPSELMVEAPFGWRDEGEILAPVSGELMILDELRRMADDGQHPSWIAERLNEQRRLRGLEPWTTRQVRQQLELYDEGALLHTRKRKRAATPVVPALEPPGDLE